MRFCIILGAMKAGTTSLFNYLAQHPEIAPCKEKEPSFFSHHYQKGMNWYLSLWTPEAIQSSVLLEASTNYTKYPSFAEARDNLVDFCENQPVSVKFIYVMRNPFKRIESQYTYAYARWTDQSLAEQIDPNGHLINVSKYAQQLDRYFDKFENDRFLLLDFDDLIQYPQKLLKEVCSFLEIDSTFHFSNIDQVHNKSTGKVITKPIDKVFKKHPNFKKFSKLLPRSLKNFISKIILRKTITQKFLLTPEQRDHVHNTLKEDMLRLHERYHIDIKKWGF